MRACCPGQGPIGEEISAEPPAETIPPEETIPAPPEPTPPPPDPTTRLESTPKTITAARVRQARTKVVMPQGDAIVSDAIETEEHVTVDFGKGSQGPAVAPVVTSRRTATAPATQKATPASTRRKKKVTEGGPSSRRAAIERGLAAPDDTAQLRQPIGAIRSCKPPRPMSLRLPKRSPIRATKFRPQAHRWLPRDHAPVRLGPRRA